MNNLSNTQKGLYGGAAIGLVAALGLAAGGPHGYAIIALAMGWLLACAAVTLTDERLGTLVTAAGCGVGAGYLFTLKFASAASGPALCTINAVIDCDRVNASPWSLAWGVPITLFGLAFYTGLAVVSALADESRTKPLLQLSAIFGALNLTYSIFLGYQSVMEGAICVVCVSMYLGNAVLLWAALRGLRRRNVLFTDGLADVPFSREFVVLAGVGVLLLGVGYDRWRGVSGQPAVAADGKVPDTVLAGLYEQASGTVTLDGTEPVLGPPDAPIEIVEFADYACPHCKEAAAELPGILAQFPEANLRFKTFPLTIECNPSIPQSAFPIRCQAAYASECARQQGRFWEMEKQLFENQGYFEPDQLLMMAQGVGLDEAQFKTCMASPMTHDAVVTDARAGEAAGLRGTPTFYLRGVDGDRWVRWTNRPDLLATLLTAVRNKQTLPPPGPPTSEE